MVLYPNKLPESERVCSGICNPLKDCIKDISLLDGDEQLISSTINQIFMVQYLHTKHLISDKEYTDSLYSSIKVLPYFYNQYLLCKMDSFGETNYAWLDSLNIWERKLYDLPMKELMLRRFNVDSCAKSNIKFENEVAFARNYLVGAGYIDKSVRGVWTLTEAGKSVELTAEMASDIFKKGVSDAKSKKTNDSDALADSDVDTIHYWIYAPGQNADKWEECYKNGYMLLGWGEIGDLGVFSSKDEMKQQMKQEYGDSSSYKNSAHATWQFVHDIKAVSYTHLTLPTN